MLPHPPDEHFQNLRGRYCLDDACLKLADAEDVQIFDRNFDYSRSLFKLRRPVPCPPGSYCHAGATFDAKLPGNFSRPQACHEGHYCPEGSTVPQGQGECPEGSYCPFGVRVSCPPGTYCPRTGHWDPFPCPPGTFNAMIGQKLCTQCPIGYNCPGFGRIDPAVCPAGFVCSRHGLATPNMRCPPGFYCSPGTVTGDPFRNDTTLRPYPCQPGTYCVGGIGYDQVRFGDPLYARNCTEGFYCELGSPDPKGSGLCPKGFYCPEGTAAPIPTPLGQQAELLGTVAPALCLSSFYAPTIETVNCYPCPPGGACENDGMSAPTLCPPGTYRSLAEVDGSVCRGCPQGTWSKQWELRDPTECLRCPTGMVCPIDGMTIPCNHDDFPTLFVPTGLGESIFECLAGNNEDDGPFYYRFFFGKLDPDRPDLIDSLNRGPQFVDATDPLDGECFFNPQRFGSSSYQRMKDFYGPLFEIAQGRQHQGYGDPDEYEGYFAKGSKRLDLLQLSLFNPAMNCTAGFFLFNDTLGEDQWYPGTCEADIICNTKEKAEALPCSEGFFCNERTGATEASSNPCPVGYVCDFGTTPDELLFAPMGKYNQLCPAGYFCFQGTGFGQRFQGVCPEGYFCPSGTGQPLVGVMANDAINRGLDARQANPFTDIVECKLLPFERLPRCISQHDQNCFDGINAELLTQSFVKDFGDGRIGPVNAATDADVRCGRDHKWRLVSDAIFRSDCQCEPQFQIAWDVYRLWQCTYARDRLCSFAQNPAESLFTSAWTRNPIVNPLEKTQTLVDQPVRYPRNEWQEYYFRPCPANARVRKCDGTNWNNDDAVCPQFCSWRELKIWVEAQYLIQTTEIAQLGTRTVVDRLVFDLK